jgi:hypothetical protein
MIRRRPHRSNPPSVNDRATAIVRSTKRPKLWTDAKLRQLMLSLIHSATETVEMTRR